jgi:hypothetical protein
VTEPAPKPTAVSDSTWEELYARDREWAQTELGKAFLRYENLTARAWQVDSNERSSDLAMKEAWAKAGDARKQLMILIRGF